ncbi:MAG: tetratricopeptide repeat protein [Anaerolineaceae bacterium]|jgi:tetratricopeptide (TPR) repeat protein|nr:tetratricopeptide repeat protein [Anaerolineaceae bacterium]
MGLPASAYRQTEAARWQNDYHQHLHQRLQATLQYVRNKPYAQLRAHLRSLLATLDEARRYPDLIPFSLELIAGLHPLPLRWGYGHLWQTHLNFALQQVGEDEQLAVYHNALAEIHFFSGAFDQAIAKAQAVLSLNVDLPDQAARAGHMLFNCYRSMGKPDQADHILAELAEKFPLADDIQQLDKGNALGWLILNQCQLELLREQGKTEDALTLVDQMLVLDSQLGSPDAILTAELTTRRSTLLWMRGAFHDAVSDLLHAIDLYNSEEDVFNAEGLQSNLGLVYWSMGELKRAETSLQSSINFYRKTGAQQLITYDIGNMGLVHFARGHLQKALDTIHEHMAHAKKIGFVSEYNRGQRNLGLVLYYFGKYEQALVELNSNQKYYERRGLREGYIIDFVWQACCYYQLGQTERAITNIRRIVEWTIENNLPIMESVVRRSLAYFLPLEEKLPHLERSLALLQTQEKILEKAAVLLTMAQVMDDREKQPTWQAGVELLIQIGAEAWLEGHSIEDPPYLPTFAQ